MRLGGVEETRGDSGLKRGDYLFIKTLDDLDSGIKTLTRMFEGWIQRAGIEGKHRVCAMRLSAVLLYSR